jgi:hypothetical protein
VKSGKLPSPAGPSGSSKPCSKPWIEAMPRTFKTLDTGYGGTLEVTVAVSPSRLSCRKARKTRIKSRCWRIKRQEWRKSSSPRQAAPWVPSRFRLEFV